MGQVLHGCATTTEAVRRAIQNSQESLRALAKRYGINQKTVAKWKQRETVADLPTGPKEAKPSRLSFPSRKRELSPNFGDGRSRSGGGGCGLTVGRLGDDLDPVVECHTENEFWQLVVSVETAPASLRGF